MRIPSPDSEYTLQQYCKTIEGLTFSQLASQLQLQIPAQPLQRKGWVGNAIELALGASAGSKSIPDFTQLGIELKTIPINHLGTPAESTFITSIPLLTIHLQCWQSSTCFDKLKRVLWIPIEGDPAIPFPYRRIGRGVIWSPSIADEAILKEDWEELTLMISTGKIADIHSNMGQYLQVRPKALNSRSLCYCYDDMGNKVPTLPRGFYLRSRFTARILLDAS